MKKNIYYSAALGLMALAFTACSSDMDCDLAEDNESAGAVATLYTYSADGDYNPDCDLKIRVVKPSGVKAVYLQVEKKAAKDKFATGVKYTSETDSTILYNEEAYRNYIIQNGKQVKFDSNNSSDTVATNLLGDWRVVAVSVADDGKISSQEATFHGVGWATITTGTFTFGTLGGLGLSSRKGILLQQNSDDESTYRLKDVFKTGYSLTFNATTLTDEDEDGTYTVLRIPDQPTGFTYGSYGSIRLRDIGVWYSSDVYVIPTSLGGYGYTSGMYEDGYCFFIGEYYVSAGYLGYSNYDIFEPDGAEAHEFVSPLAENLK